MTERERRRRIVAHLRAGLPDDAAKEMASSQEPYPGDGLLHHAIGLAFASNGTLGAALEQLEAAAGLSPDSAAILADLAQVRLAQGKIEEAIESAENSLDIDGSLLIAHFTLGRACLAAECRRQAKHPSSPKPGFPFPLIDGKQPLYLRALREMEIALDNSPPYAVAIHAALAFAYLRAGHYHATLEQLQREISALPPGNDADRVADRLQSVEYEIARERYWSEIEDTKPAAADDTEPESLLRIVHASATSTREDEAAEMLAKVKAAGYGPRPAVISRLDNPDETGQHLADVHLLIGGGLECIHNSRLRFIPFSSIASIAFGTPSHWRTADVTPATGETFSVIVPTLYRLSLRSPNDLIQSGRFTQFKYAPGETHHAFAIGTRNFTTENAVIPFTDIASIRFI